MLNIHDVAPIFKHFTNETGIDITERARTQIVDLINCVEADAHETWQSQESLPEDYFIKWKERLPEVLMQIKEEHRLAKSMTAIDVVYWTGQHLRDRGTWVCFPGPGELPGDVRSQWFPWCLELAQGQQNFSESVE